MEAEFFHILVPEDLHVTIPMFSPQLETSTLLATVWDWHPHKPDAFLGEVLLDLGSAALNGTASWYPLEEHDENSGPLPPATPKPRHALKQERVRLSECINTF